MKKYITILTLLLVLLSCGLKQQEETASISVYPSDTISMQYDQDNFYMPTLSAVVNDSLHFNVFFDTGFPGKYFAASDSIRDLFAGDSASIQIGKQKQQLYADFESSRNNIFNVLGKNTIIVGREFFENKIIELSFEYRYILVYEKLPDVTEYSKTKITLSPHSHLAVPVEIVLQGKIIKDTALIDTGNNGYGSCRTELIDKYGIDTKQVTYHGKSMTSAGLFPAFPLPVDTIKIGDSYIAKQDMRIAVRNRDANLIGVKTLENFSVILDLKDHNLYLKKN